MKKRLIALALILTIPLALMAQPYPIALRIASALESAWAAFGGAVTVTGTGAYDLSLRTAIAAEGIQTVLTDEYWDDSQVPALAITLGSTAPGLISFSTNDNLKIYGFDGVNRDEMGHFSLQLSHRYEEGTPIRPHVHWCRSTDPAETAFTNVVWRLVYAFQTPNGHFANTYTNMITNYVAGTNWYHQISSFTPITNTAAKVSSILVGSLTRMSSDDGDTYTGDVALLGFDCHFLVDSFGSREELVK